MPPSLPLNHLRSDSLLGCSPSLERLRGYRSWGGLIRGQGQGWGPFPPTARSRDTKPDLSHTDLSHTELPMLSRPALEPLDLSLLDLGTGPSPRCICGNPRSNPRLVGKLSGRLLRRRPRTRTCPAPARPVVAQVACSRRDGDRLEGVGEFCCRDQLPVEADQVRVRPARPLSAAWPPSARPRGRDRAAG